MARVFVFGIMAVAFLFHNPPVLADPLLWSVEAGGNGHYYEAIAVPGGCGWNLAKTLAEAGSWQGSPGYLATITSQAENDWIWETLSHPAEHWFGAYQLPGSSEPAGGWSWVSGEPWAFDNWHAGEPNNGGDFGNECAALFVDVSLIGEWNDAAPVVLRPGYIVEFETSPTATEGESWGGIKRQFRD